MSHLGAVGAGEVKLDVCAVGLQDIPGAVLKERVEPAMECIAPAGRTVAWISKAAISGNLPDLASSTPDAMVLLHRNFSIAMHQTGPMKLNPG